MSRPASPQPNTEPLLRWVFLGAILASIGIGFVLGSTLTPTFGDRTANILFATFFFVSVSQVAVTRYVLLPNMVKGTTPEQRAQRASATAYAFAEAPASYGLIVAIVSGEGWMALALGGVSLAAWQVMRSYLAALQAAAAEDFPTL